MARNWQLQEAKNKFSEVVEEALKDGPQVITRRGVETAVVMAFADYRKMLLGQKSLSEFFRDSPLAGLDLELARDNSPIRDDVGL
ncbi:MAG TPA: type II toxin-antitoxin system Phd/YefM family antitoxin [Chloroflexia bacterium]|nr:type II toxin-antitoxin system Phd/YefM family antitoxin [Chloroflexia bacterium]